MTTYYNRFDPAQNYDSHLFAAGRGLQSAELNELQSASQHRLKGIADALFKDGDVVRDARVTIDGATAQCQSGVVYIRGAMRGVPTATLTIPTTGVVAIGVRLTTTTVTAIDDPDLLDPAPSTRNYNQPGADRQQVEPSWSLGGSGDGDFFPVYSVTDGVLDPKEPPPNLDAVTQAIARYDRDSSGGTYVVRGMTVTALPDPNASTQAYSIAEGRARVYGFAIEYQTARRVTPAADPDLKQITSEPHLSTTSGSQRVAFNRTPATDITSVTITAQKTVTMTHGPVTGAQDPLPDSSVLALISVSQGAVNYVAGTDYQLTSAKVDWSLSGAEPAPGSTYSVTYTYQTTVTPDTPTDTDFGVTGALSGTLIQVTYKQKLPRIDRLCINSEGVPVWVKGISAEYYPQIPSVPDDVLPLASIYQTWSSTRRVENDGVRVVPMPALAAVDARFDLVFQLLAQQRLESDIHTREAGTKKGLFTDPFIDDSQRDAGTAQTAAIFNGELQLPISASAYYPSADISTATTLTLVPSVALSQIFRTGSQLINPYMAFSPTPGAMRLSPSVDRWTAVTTAWASDITRRFFQTRIGLQAGSAVQVTTNRALVGIVRAPAETLRQISVGYVLSNFGAGEVLSSLTFDGVSVMPGGSPPTADSSGTITGTFTIPANIPTGDKLVRATGAGGSTATATFSGQGIVERQTWQSQTTITETAWQSPPPPMRFSGRQTDPIAQTFTPGENMQVCGVDLWFAAAPTTRTTVQIRATAVGLPTATVLAETSLAPSSILTGGASTRVTFPRPVGLIGGQEYAIVVLCDDATGSLSIAELGKFDSANQRWITTQAYTVGVLLSSSNASTWTPHQDRDLTFQLLRASYTQASRTIALGNVAVSGATDLMLMGYYERPSGTARIEFSATLPDASVYKLEDGQPLQLATAITGNVTLSAMLYGSADESPILFPGTQLVAGTIGASGTYVSRAIPAGSGVTIKVIYDAIVPSGASITAAYKGIDVGDTWANITSVTTRAVDDGFVEYTHTITGVTETSVQTRLTLAGSAAARPRVRDLRVIVL